MADVERRAIAPIGVAGRCALSRRSRSHLAGHQFWPSLDLALHRRFRPIVGSAREPCARDRPAAAVEEVLRLAAQRRFAGVLLARLGNGCARCLAARVSSTTLADLPVGRHGALAHLTRVEIAHAGGENPRSLTRAVGDAAARVRCAEACAAKGSRRLSSLRVHSNRSFRSLNLAAPHLDAVRRIVASHAARRTGRTGRFARRS